MFGFLFGGWRKASKCKKLLQQLQSRLKLLKNKKYAISRHLRDDIALFIRINDPSRALLRAEQLFLVENSISVYDLLLQFSDFIILHFSSIRKHRELLNDEINEAVSSLVFASARCGELPELLSIRELLKQRYGQRYATNVLHLLPGNLVNLQIKDKLLTTSVPEDEKSRLLDEIAKESGHCFKMLRLEYTPEIEKQVNEDEEKTVMDLDISSCSDDQSPDPEVYKFSLTDVKEERSKEETSMEDDYIEEAQVGRDQRVFRFRETSEKEKRASSSSSSLSSLRGFRDMESLRYYKRRKRIHRRKRSSSHCYHIVYNVFEVTKEEEEEGRRLLTKHVHPKLPDYDQIVTQFKALRKQQCMHS